MVKKIFFYVIYLIYILYVKKWLMFRFDYELYVWIIIVVFYVYKVDIFFLVDNMRG